MSGGDRPGPRHGRRARARVSRGPLRRGLAIVLLGGVLVGMGVTDRMVARAAPPPSGTPSDAVHAVTAVTATGAESSAWYCAGGTGAQGGAPGTLVFANANPQPVTGTVTLIPALSATAGSAGPFAGGVAVPVTVPADAQLNVVEDQLGSSAVQAAAVVLDGGGVAVAQAVSSPLGWSMAPCATEAASHWYFAHGATAQAGGLLLNLFNPGATDAAVDVSLVSSTAGVLAPSAYQGIDVPPGALVTENIGDHAPDDAAIATEVSALSGAVVASELESVGTAGDGGLSIMTGTPVPATQWSFPQNVDGAGTSVAFRVLNPSTRPAVVLVAIRLSGGEVAEPLTMRVPPQTLSTLVAGDQTRIPSGSTYALTFTSSTGVVVVRQVTAPPGPAAPVPEGGDVVGVIGAATHWLVPALVTPGTGAASVAVVDLGPRPATVEFTTPSGRALSGQKAHTVSPHTPLVIAPVTGDPFGVAPFAVRADEPVAVELDGQPVAASGIVVAPAFPVR